MKTLPLPPLNLPPQTTPPPRTARLHTKTTLTFGPARPHTKQIHAPDTARLHTKTTLAFGPARLYTKQIHASGFAHLHTNITTRKAPRPFAVRPARRVECGSRSIPRDERRRMKQVDCLSEASFELPAAVNRSKAEQDNGKPYGVSQHLRVATLLQMQLSAHGRRFSFACALQGIASFLFLGGQEKK